MKFVYTYVFRSRGLVLVFVMAALLWTACSPGSRAQEERAKDKSKQMLDTMHKDADSAIRKYTSGQVPAAPPTKKEKKQ